MKEIKETVKRTFKGYNDHFNHAPTGNMTEITDQEFAAGMCSNSWEFTDYKQVTSGPFEGLSLTIFAGKDFKEGLVGMCIGRHWDPRKGFFHRYFAFGDWASYTQDLCAQFAGDNS